MRVDNNINHNHNNNNNNNNAYYYECNSNSDGGGDNNKFPSPKQLLYKFRNSPQQQQQQQRRRRIIRRILFLGIVLICLSYCFAQIIISVSVIMISSQSQSSSSSSSSSFDYDNNEEEEEEEVDVSVAKTIMAGQQAAAATATTTTSSQRLILSHVEENNQDETTTTTTTTKTTPKTKTKNVIYNYRINPQKFINKYKSCLMDGHQYCHTQYLHIQKTGGTTIEYNLDSIHYKGGGDSCCDEKLLEEFNLNPSKFCFASFQSYQILPKKFPYIIQKCQQLFDQTYYEEEEKLLLRNNINRTSLQPNISQQQQQQQPPPPPSPRRRHRIQILISIREPISRTLSLIHQQCNRNPRRRPQRLIQACNRCNYYYGNDTKVWDQFTLRTNEEYQDLDGLLSQRRRIITDPTTSRNNHPLIKSNIPNVREKPSSTSMINLKNTSDKMALPYKSNSKNNNNNAAGKTTTATITTIPNEIPILILDVEDLNTFFTNLKSSSDLTEFEFFLQRFPKRTSKSHNKELLSRCKFQLSTEMIKSISNSSSKSYRNITFAGAVVEQ